MRRGRREHQQQQLDRLVPFRRAGDGRAPVAEQRVGQLHELGDHRVEAERLVVGRDVAQRPVRGRSDRRAAPSASDSPAGSDPASGSPGSRPCGSSSERPDPVQEAVDAADPGRAPRPALVPRAHEHQEQPNRVRAVAVDELVGILDVAARLAHPLAVGAQDLALVEQALERLAVADEPDVGHRLGEEAAVEQVHDRVLGAAGVLVDRRPAIGHLAIHRTTRLVGRQVAEPVPRRIHERVHRVGLAPGRSAADRALDAQEGLVVVERIVAAARVVDRLRQPDRQLLVRDRDDAVSPGSR